MIVEVVLTKEMELEDYKKMIPQVQTKGWKITAYQPNFYSPGLKKKIEE